MENRIRQAREKLGWSQQQLAEAVGTSQQQIARIETGTQSVKLDIALGIAATLHADLGKLFPATRKLIGRGKKSKDRNALVELHDDPKAVAEFESAGVDLDPATWLLKLRLRGGTQLSFVCSTAEVQRLRQNLRARDSGTPFVVFRSPVVAVALNINHLTHYHELWDGHTSPDWHDDDVPREEVAVFFSDSSEPELFDVDVDVGLPSLEDDEGQMRGLLFTLETFLEPGEFVGFRDSDGEDAFLRAEDVALLSVPLRILDSRLNDALLEAEDQMMTDEEELAEVKVESPSPGRTTPLEGD
jgi:transcriptional regulator with XRE-family HTH domain